MGELKYHPCEIERVLSSLCVLVDTREQDTLRARRRYKNIGIPYKRQTLKFGDYSAEMTDISGNIITLENVVVIERKMNLDELANCFCRGRERFRKEFEKAKNSGARVYLIIENDSLDDAYNHTYRSQMTPQSLIMSILAWAIEFGITPYFISAANSGKLIHDILYREAKNYLEQVEE